MTFNHKICSSNSMHSVSMANMFDNYSVENAKDNKMRSLGKFIC